MSVFKSYFLSGLLCMGLLQANDVVSQSSTSKDNVSWSNYPVGNIIFKSLSPETEGARIYHELVSNPEDYIASQARKVLETLYFSPSDSIPDIKTIHYTLKEYDGISAKGGNPPTIYIDYSTKWVEKTFGKELNKEKVDYETRGVLYHELTHGFQLEPQGIGSYGTNKTFFAMIEGVADAVRLLNGCFTEKDRPKGGSYMDGYRTTGFFLAWLTKTKDPDFLKKFNQSTLKVIPWSFDGAIKYALGNQFQIDGLWNQYLTEMGDIAVANNQNPR